MTSVSLLVPEYNEQHLAAASLARDTEESQ
jgi:hypothetical protein